jgi:hypothetical protein
MPQKYRRMADFHEYYSGARVAPYLTIFIGGNHEASNYLFELYYGGWVAPNIYYMGAANIIRLGSLRIAGLSGIWKGYDYRKPHFERLPYSRDEYHSIFHVRELDVRKLLSVRTQVDIALSHDWPKGVEWRGHHRWLFNKKDRFEADAINGKLGSVAAALCLDRLRPAYWFSAHLHIKYPALIQHERPGEVQAKPSTLPSRLQGLGEELADKASTRANSERNRSSKKIPPQIAPVSSPSNGHRAGVQDRTEVSAWQNFYLGAQKDDAEERDRALKAHQVRQDEAAHTGIRPRPQYTFNETFKKVETNEGLGRSIAAVTISSPGLDHGDEVPNLDGCGASSLKRRRGTNSPDVTEQQPNQHTAANSENLAAVDLNTLDGVTASSAAVTSAIENNPDAVEIDLDDTDSEAGIDKVHQPPKPGFAPANDTISNYPKAVQVPGAGAPTITGIGSHNPQTPIAIFTEDSDDGGVRLNPLAQPFQPHPTVHSLGECNRSEDFNPLEHPCSITSSVTEWRESEEMNPRAESFSLQGNSASLAKSEYGNVGVDEMIAAERKEISTLDNEPRSIPDEENDYPDVNGGEPVVNNEVSEEMRAQLAALSGSFVPQQITKSEPLPFPDAITNEKTEFLALDKCEANREFLQLLEVSAISDPPPQRLANRPLRLQYDPEWLAIIRVFAPDLELGGNPTKTIAPDRGETYYCNRIAEEAEWIDEHVVKRNLLEIPENFTTTAPVYDPDLRVDSSEMPREYTNPQTSEFCTLLGIENRFNIGEEEREARMARGPRPDTDHRDIRGGRHEGRSRGGGRGRSHNVNRGGGRGGGRGVRGGRGHGRGRW